MTRHRKVCHSTYMTIAFSTDRWEKVKQAHRDWWEGALDRPLVPIWVRNRPPQRPEPKAPLLTQATCADLSIPADDVIDRLDYELSLTTFYGDAFPYLNFDCFGPGVLAAMLGARLDNSSGRVWFHPEKDVELSELRFKFDPDNIWFRRMAELYAAGMRRWEGQVLMGMADLGGNLDILSTFRPSDQLPMDLYDEPDEVKRLVWEVHEAWHACYRALNEVLHPVNPGYSNWLKVYSDTPFYVFQCDFAYMISPDMFEEFAKPELAASAEKLDRAFYHLDGVGQLPHLDSILSIDAFQGVQWVPGAGQPSTAHWPEVFQRIRAAGKRIQFYGGFNELAAVRDQLDGDLSGVHLWTGGLESDPEVIERRLPEFGVEP